MNKRIALVILVLSVLTLVYWALFGIRRTGVGTVQRLVYQNVKKGESSEELIRFLDAQHLEHSELTRPSFMSLWGRDYSNQNVVVAIRRNTWTSMLQTESVQLVFVFDDKNRLIKSDVFPVYTGL